MLSMLGDWGKRSQCGVYLALSPGTRAFGVLNHLLFEYFSAQTADM